MGRGVPFTEKELKYMQNNVDKMTNKEIANALDRKYCSVTSRLIRIREEKGIEKKPVILTECPECGSSRINEVEHAYFTGVKFFCVNCLSEFDRYGKWIRPIL